MYVTKERMILLDTQVFMGEMAAGNHQEQVDILKEQANGVFCEFRFLSVFTTIFIEVIYNVKFSQLLLSWIMRFLYLINRNRMMEMF